MKTKHLLLAMLFVTSSIALLAQDRLQHFPHQHMPVVSHELNLPSNGNDESLDEFRRHKIELNTFRTEGNSYKNAQNANEIVYLCDSTFSYNTIGEQKRITYTRDEKGKILILHAQTWNSGEGVWENKYKYNYTYDVSGNKLMDISQRWVGDWVNESKVIYTNDASGNILIKLNQNWSIGTGNWINSEKYSYALDASGQIISYVYQKWKTAINNWENQTRYIYTYDASGNWLTGLIQEWDTGINAWVDKYFGNYTYDVAGNWLGLHLKVWNKANSVWENSYKSTYTYNASKQMLSEQQQNWNSGINMWVNSYRRIHTYEAAGNKLLEFEYMWNTQINDWESSLKTEYEYDYTSQTVAAIQYEWSGVWVPTSFGYIELFIFNNHLFTTNGYKAEAYYSSYSLGIEDKDIKTKVNTTFCSPNPANDLVNVTNLYKKEAILKIYNMTGNLVDKKLIDKEPNQVSVQNLSPGIYLFVLQFENSRIQNKVVVY